MSEDKATETLDSDTLVERLRPNLDELERERQDRRRKALIWIGVLGGVVLAVAIASALGMARQAGAQGAGFGTFPLIFGGVLLVLLGARLNKRWQKRFGAMMIPAVLEQIDSSFDYREDADKNFVKPYSELELIGYWNRGEVQHRIDGSYQGRRFEMVHANLLNHSGGKNSSTTSVFHGLLVRIQTRNNVEPGLCIRPNFGWFAKAFGKRSVPTGNEAFDDVFLVSPDDGSDLDTEKLNQSLTPDWQEALLAINKQLGITAHGQPKLSAGLKYDALYLTVALYREGRSFGPFRSERSRPFPEVGNLFSSDPDLEGSLRRLIDDIGTFRRIIDRLPREA